MGNVVHYGILSFLIILVNIPFGKWKQNVKKYSFRWFLFVHLPVPLVVVLRMLFHVSLSPLTIPILAGSFFTGQFIGGRWR